MTRRRLKVRRGAEFPLPIFLPVFRPGGASAPPAGQRDLPGPTPFVRGAWQGAPHIRGCMVNAFFLYKDREMRRRFREGLTLAEHVGFDGLSYDRPPASPAPSPPFSRPERQVGRLRRSRTVLFDGLLCTDSGAFQGFSGRLFLSNRDIVTFQDAIRTDVASPLDLVTPPGDRRSVARRKLEVTHKRVREALVLAESCILAGVQQGGRFIDLRRRGVEELMRMGVEYLALGSLVPFFNRNHDLAFAGEVIRDARLAAGPEIPIHVYGAGDPVELPFMVRLGADIFDSASYGRFAEGGWYMTPYGALRSADRLASGEYRCDCPVCSSYASGDGSVADVFGARDDLSVHNLWTICTTLDRIGEALDEDTLDDLIEGVLERHAAWFPESSLASSWHRLWSDDA